MGALALGALAVYTFGYRTTGSVDESNRALVAAQEFDQWFVPAGQGSLSPVVVKIAPNLWRATWMRSGTAVTCVAIDLARLAISSTADSVHETGIGEIPCP